MSTFCKAEKKTERKSHNYNDQNTKNHKTKIWDEQNISLTLCDPSKIWWTSVLTHISEAKIYDRRIMKNVIHKAADFAYPIVIE